MKKLFFIVAFLFSFSTYSQGSFEWIRHHGDEYPSHTEWVKDIQSDQWGNIYVAGEVNDLWVRDSNGTIIKSKVNPTLDSLYNNGGKDVWLAKYNPQGKLLWHRYAGSGSDDKYFDMVADENGNCYVAGLMKWHHQRPPSSFDERILSIDSLGSFIAKVDSGGNLLWHRSFGGDTISNGAFIHYQAELHNLSFDKNRLSAFIYGGGTSIRLPTSF